MPLALLAIGLILLVTAMRGTTGELFTLLKGDFTGRGNFLIWILVLVAVGSVGYIKELRSVSNAFLVLILIIFILAANKGGRDFFSSLVSQVSGTQFTAGA